MGTRLDQAMRGFLVPDPRLGCDDLAVNDASATGSDYSQVGPRPGSSTTDDELSRIVPLVLGALEAPIDVEVVAAGDPAISGGARVRWKFQSELATEFRGYCDPQWSTVWTPVRWLANLSNAGIGYGACLHPQTQRVIVVNVDDGGTPDHIESQRSVGIDGFERVGDIDDGTLYPTGSGSLACCSLPSGRILAIATPQEFADGVVHYSDDVGDTWSTYAQHVVEGGIPLPTPQLQAMAATNEGEVLLIVDHQNGELSQFASRNLGASFEPIELNAQIGEKPAICVLPSGRICVVYGSDTNIRPRARTIASPFDPLSGADEIEIGSLNGDEIAACSDDRGVIWAFSGGPPIRVHVSTDEGATWTSPRYGPLAGASGNREAQEWRAVCARGFVWLCHRPFDGGPGTRNEAIGAFRFGGWSNLEPAAALEPGVQSTTEQKGWSDGDGEFFSRTWFPSGEPSQAGFSHNGAVNMLVDDTSSHGNGTGVIDCAIGQDGYYDEPTPEGATTVYAQCSIGDVAGVGAGGNLLAAYGGIRLDVEIGNQHSIVEIRLAGIGGEVRFRVHDVVAAADLYDSPATNPPMPPPRGAANADLFLELLFEQQLNQLELWFRRTDTVNWIKAGTFALSSAGGGANGLVEMGNLVVADVSSGRVATVWRAFNISGGNVSGPFSGSAFPVGPFADELQRGAELGTNPLSLVDAGTLDVDEGALALRGGPARFGEIHEIPVIHDFPIRSLFWDCSPSRSEVWRSDDDQVEQVVAFAFPEQTRIGGSFLLGLFVAGANFPVARLEVDTTGAGAWSTVATLRLGADFGSIGYERLGDMLRPGSAPLNEGERFLNRAELVGGVARWGAGAAARAERILANSAGGWTDKATNTIQPFVRVGSDGLVGSGTAGNDLTLQAPAGLVLAYLDDPAGLVYGVRVVVEAADTPEGFHEAGLLMVGALTPFGQQWSRGYSVETSPNTTRTTSTAGTIRKTQLGENATRFGVAWPDGVKLHAMRDGIDVDYLGPAGKPPVVADHDVWGQLWGLLDELEGGELPVVIVTKLPADDETLTDRTLFAFATLDGSARFDHVLGDEGENEFGRVAGIQATEIK